MKSRVFASITFLLFSFTSAITALALEVRIQAPGSDEVPLMGSPTVNVDGGYGPIQPNGKALFTIEKCITGCSGGRPRVFVSAGSWDSLVFTDAKITNNAPIGTAAQTLTIRIDSGAYTATAAGSRSDYPYAVELNGSFSALAGAGDPKVGNKFTVNARACQAQRNCDEGGTCTPSFPSLCSGDFSGSTEAPPIDNNPELDAGESLGEFFDPNLYSVVAPPFKFAGSSSFGTKEMENLPCPWFTSSFSNQCDPALVITAEISLKGGHSANLPGSLGAFVVPVPADEGGAEIMAELFASLGGKGGVIYEASLEPSPGTDLRTIFFRDNRQNSTEPWVTKRGAVGNANDEASGEAIRSQTTVKLENSGRGQVRARGLCPAGIPCPQSNELRVEVYCGVTAVFETSLRLDAKGDGTADVVSGLPCEDPGVVILDGGYWVAAPVVF